MQGNQDRINQLSVIENAVNPLFGGELECQISRCLTSKFDKNTGKIKTYYDWTELFGIISAEVYRSVENVYDTNELSGGVKGAIGALKEFVNVKKNLALGVAARKRTKKIQEFYSEHLLSGKYRAELLEICSQIEDEELLIPSIAGYIKMLCEKLKEELENGK